MVPKWFRRPAPCSSCTPNFTFQGSKFAVDGVRADEHALHETIEITQGFTPWFEIGFYVFMSYRAGEGYQWVGDHIRPA